MATAVSFTMSMAACQGRPINARSKVSIASRSSAFAWPGGPVRSGAKKLGAVRIGLSKKKAGDSLSVKAVTSAPPPSPAVGSPDPTPTPAASAPAPPPPPAGDALPPPAVFNAAVGMSQKKAGQDPLTTLVLGFTAGALIGIGALLMASVGGSSPALASSNPGLCNFLKGAVGLPCGLTLVILTGAELFTGNVFVMLSGWLKGAVSTSAVARNWALSYVANFVGSVFLAWMAFTAKTMAAPTMTASAIGIATMKCNLAWSVAFTKGILCNWLVCLGVWGTIASTSIAGKILAIFWPISTFICLGFEHSVANMFLIPHGMMLGANVTFGQMMANNIIPVTLGNMVGAIVFVAGVHYVAYGRK